MIFIIATLSLGVFVVPIEKYPERMSIILVLMLTSVAFKFVVGEDLPKTPYFTTLDLYMAFCFLFMTVVTLENTLVAAIATRWSRGINFLSIDRINLAFAI